MIDTVGRKEIMMERRKERSTKERSSRLEELMKRRYF